MIESFEDSYGGYQVVANSFKRVRPPLISVVMSVYNGEATVRDAINSVLAQSVEDFELIIVNDGSTDETKEILEGYLKEDDRIVLINQNNLGLTKSLNRAIDLAKGQFIARQDADDCSVVNRFSLQLELITKHKLDLIANRAFKNNKIVPHKILLKNVNLHTLLLGNVFVHGTFFLKSAVIKKLKYDQNFKYSQDIELVCRMLSLQLKVGYSLTPIYSLTVSPQCISSMHSEEQAAMFKSAVNQYCNSSILNNVILNYGNSIAVMLVRIMLSWLTFGRSFQKSSVKILT